MPKKEQHKISQREWQLWTTPKDSKIQSKGNWVWMVEMRVVGVVVVVTVAEEIIEQRVEVDYMWKIQVLLLLG